MENLLNAVIVNVDTRCVEIKLDPANISRILQAEKTKKITINSEVTMHYITSKPGNNAMASTISNKIINGPVIFTSKKKVISKNDIIKLLEVGNSKLLDTYKEKKKLVSSGKAAAIINKSAIPKDIIDLNMLSRLNNPQTNLPTIASSILSNIPEISQYAKIH